MERGSLEIWWCRVTTKPVCYRIAVFRLTFCFGCCASLLLFTLSLSLAIILFCITYSHNGHISQTVRHTISLLNNGGSKRDQRPPLYDTLARSRTSLPTCFPLVPAEQ